MSKKAQVPHRDQFESNLALAPISLEPRLPDPLQSVKPIVPELSQEDVYHLRALDAELELLELKLELKLGEKARLIESVKDRIANVKHL